MKLGKILAGFGLAILASAPVAAQHAGGAGHAGGASHPAGAGRAGMPAGGHPGMPAGIPRTLPGSRGIPIVPFHPLGTIPTSQRTRPFAAPFLPPPNAGYQAPVVPFAPGFRPPGFGLRIHGLRLYNNWPFFYYYSFGAPVCGPFFQATPSWPAYDFPAPSRAITARSSVSVTCRRIRLRFRRELMVAFRVR